MSRITCLTDCALGLLCTLLWVPVASAQPTSAARIPQPVAGVPAQARVQPGTIYLCWISTNTQPSVVYRSGVFHVAASTSLGAINDGFQNYLRKNYHLQFSGSVCGDLFYDHDGERYIQQLEQTAKTNKSQIIVVDWKYVPGQDIPPPPQVSVARILHCFCSSYLDATPDVTYFSDMFDAPERTDLNSVRDDFDRFVKAKYAPQSRGSGGCTSQSDKNEAKSRARKVVETGWKPKTLPKADSRH